MDFSDLISAAEQNVILISREPYQISLPCTNRNIFQTVGAAKDLSKNVHKQGFRSEQGKTMLLKNAGIDMDAVAEKIGRIQSVRFDFSSDWDESDVSSHLESTRENRILAELSYEITGTFARSQQLAQKQSARNSDSHKSEILNHLLKEDNIENILCPRGHPKDEKHPAAGGKFRPSGAQGDLTRTFVCSYTYEQIYYDSLLECKETKRRTSTDPNYVKTFIRNVYQGPSNIQVQDIWNMVGSIDTFRPTGDKAVFPERNSMAWVRPSIKYLEKAYSAYMFRVTQKNELCSIPEVVYDVIKELVKNVTRANVGVTKLPNLVMVNDDEPIWALIYYTFRSGHLSLIQDQIEKNLLKCCTQSTILDLFRLLRDYNKQDFLINQSVDDSYPCRSETTVTAGEDPYFAILRSIVKKTNLDHNSVKNIVSTCEDYLWLKLHQVVFTKTEHMTTKELQKKTKTHMKSPKLHFDMFQYWIFDSAGYEQEPLACNPMVRFMSLLLTCQYETALLCLHRDVDFRIHAVYLAIAMFKQGLIQNSPDSIIPKIRLPFARIDENFPFDITDYLKSQLNIPSLVEDYVWDSKFFRKSHESHKLDKNFFQHSSRDNLDMKLFQNSSRDNVNSKFFWNSSRDDKERKVFQNFSRANFDSKYFQNTSSDNTERKFFKYSRPKSHDLDSRSFQNLSHKSQGNQNLENKNLKNSSPDDSDLKFFQNFSRGLNVNYDYEKCLLLFLSLQDIRSGDDRNGNDMSGNDRNRDDASANDKIEDDRNRNDRSDSDKSKNDKIEDDLSSNDRSKNDRGSNDRSANDRGSNDRSANDGSDNDRSGHHRSLFEEKVAEFIIKFNCYEELFGKYQVNICELNQRLRLMRDDISSSPHPLMSQDLWDDLSCHCGFQHIPSNKFGVEDMDDFESYLSDFKLGPVAFRDGILFRLVDGDEARFKEVVKAAADAVRDCGMDRDAIQLSTICGDISVAIKLINRKLAYHFDKNPESEDRKTYLKMASTLANLLPYYTQPDSSSSLIKAFRVSTLACSAYESYSTGLYEKAIRTIERMEVIPLDVKNLEVKHREFANFDACVKATIGTMVHILVNMYEHTLNTLAEASSLGLLEQSRALQVQWRQRASALSLFTSKDENWFYHEGTTKKLLEINIKLETLNL